MTLPPVPKFPIREVLVALGADPHSIPTGYGWKKLSCPFHGVDKNPSATVNTQLNAFCCFTCELKGDAIALVRRVNHCDFQTALRFCEESVGETGGPIPRTSGWGDTLSL